METRHRWPPWALGMNAHWAGLGPWHGWALVMDGLPWALGMDVPWAGMGPGNGWTTMGPRDLGPGLGCTLGMDVSWVSMGLTH